MNEKVPVLFRESFIMRLHFPAITPFSVGCFPGPIKSKLPFIASTFRCDVLSQLNWSIPPQLKTTWYFNQQVSKLIRRVWNLIKEIERILQFFFEVNNYWIFLLNRSFALTLASSSSFIYTSRAFENIS